LGAVGDGRAESECLEEPQEGHGRCWPPDRLGNPSDNNNLKYFQKVKVLCRNLLLESSLQCIYCNILISNYLLKIIKETSTTGISMNYTAIVLLKYRFVERKIISRMRNINYHCTSSFFDNC
ncbi:unnamed protein product, partial [Amoebophrya sp. A25]